LYVPLYSCANNIVMKLPVPKSTDTVSHRITSGTQTAEYKSSEKAWYWNIAKLQGGSEVSASVKVNCIASLACGKNYTSDSF